MDFGSSRPVPLWRLVHWTIASHTGLVTAIVAALLRFTPAARLYETHCGNALSVGCLTALGDGCSHTDHYGIPCTEAVSSRIVSDLLTLVSSYLFKDRARRIRAVWTRIAGSFVPIRHSSQKNARTGTGLMPVS